MALSANRQNNSRHGRPLLTWRRTVEMKRIHFMRDHPPLQRNMPPEDIGHSRWMHLRMAILNIL
jgi:hypothetical protein